MAPLSSARRWVAFNAVGVLGIGLQLATLAGLLHAGLPLPLATLIAVESAILHNFAWHEQWTWRGAKADTLLQRLLRFHALNGVVSIIGNVVITAGLTQLSVDPLLANVVAITMCGMVNFLAADRLVFRAGAAALVLGLVTSTPIAASDDMVAGGPTAATLAAWDKYVAA